MYPAENIKELITLLVNEASTWAHSNTRVARRVRKHRDAVLDMCGAEDNTEVLKNFFRINPWFRAESLASCIVLSAKRPPDMDRVDPARARALAAWREIVKFAVSVTRGRVQRRCMGELNQLRRMGYY